MSTLRLNRAGKRIAVRATKYQLDIDLTDALAVLSTASGKCLFEFPLDVRMQIGRRHVHIRGPFSARIRKNSVVLQATRPEAVFSSQLLILNFEKDHFTFGYEATVAASRGIRPGTVDYFRDPELGLRIRHLKEAFCIPDHPVSEIDYRNVFPAASLCGLSSPPVLNIALVFYNGLVGLGLLDYSNATHFGLLNPFSEQGDPFLGLRVDALGENLTFANGQTYTGPKVAFTFPSGSWESIACFRRLLQKKKLLTGLSLDRRPEWWKRPTYCTYGDEIMSFHRTLYTDHYWSAPGYNQEWVRTMVLRAERRLGYRRFSVIVDAFWQRPWDPDPLADPERFPDMRGLIDWLHDRGHKVLLWYAPLVRGKLRGIGRITKQYGIETHSEEFVGGSKLDFSSARAGAYLEEICRRLFGSQRPGLDADGVKLDFVAAIGSCEKGTKYTCPRNGMGFAASRRFLELFHAAAKTVKPDVLVNYSATDPRVAHLFGANRLHDTKVTPLERERRARASVLANPHLLIDSDGAVMMSDWVEHTYTAAAIYGTPSLYYIDRFNDGQKLSSRDMRTLGRLMLLSEQRYWGVPEFVDYGSWRLRRADGSVVGESYEGQFCWIQTGRNTAGAIGFRHQKREIDFHDKHIASISPRPGGLEIKNAKAKARWAGGVLYNITFKK